MHYSIYAFVCLWEISAKSIILKNDRSKACSCRFKNAMLWGGSYYKYFSNSALQIGYKFE